MSAVLLRSRTTVRALLRRRLAFAVLFPRLRQRIVEGYDCTEAGARQARSRLTAAITAFDQRLDRQAYFFDQRFSRADLTFAALTAFMVMPSEYPVRWPACYASAVSAQLATARLRN